jgi:hypothetical protein
MDYILFHQMAVVLGTHHKPASFKTCPSPSFFF